METFVFVVAALAALAAGLVVLLHRNAVMCALALVANLLSVAVLYLLLEAQLIAALQVIIYAGAIMVLILFVIMLLALPREGAVRRSGLAAPLAALAGALALLAAFARAIAAMPPPRPPVEGFGEAASIARSLYSTWFYPFEIISLVLVAAMAGAILLAKREI